MTRGVRVRKTPRKKSQANAIPARPKGEEVNPEDPIFRVFPLTRKRSRMKDASENLDDYLYGRGA